MRLENIIYNITIFRSKKFIITKYDKDFFKNFKSISKKYLNDIIPSIVDIGDSMFSFNYKFAPSYIAWYKTFKELHVPENEIDKNLWKMNELMLTIFPKALLKLFGKPYVNSLKKSSRKHIERQENNLLNTYDWKVKFKEINEDTFELDITECAFKKLSIDFDVKGLLPGICRMDYLFCNLLNNGFERTKTLGDGDDCCNCKYSINGPCKWNPEEGFIYRK